MRGTRYRLCMDLDGTGSSFSFHDTGFSVYITPVSVVRHQVLVSGASLACHVFREGKRGRNLGSEARKRGETQHIAWFSRSSRLELSCHGTGTLSTSCSTASTVYLATYCDLNSATGFLGGWEIHSDASTATEALFLGGFWALERA